MVNVAVLGSQGFIGSSLFAEMKSKGIACTSIDSARNDPKSLSSLLKFGKFSHLVIAIGKASSTKSRAMSLAEFSDFVDMFWFSKVELEQLKGIIWFGSGAEFGGGSKELVRDTLRAPVGDYALAKSLESSVFESLRNFGLRVQIIRPSTVFGPGQKGTMLFPQIVEALREFKPIVIKSPDAIRDFIHVSDVAKLVSLSVCREDLLSSSFICASGSSVSVREFVSLVAEMVGPRAEDLFKFPDSLAGPESSEFFDITETVTTFGWDPSGSLADRLRDSLVQEGII